jgi:hypothetical protein
MPVEPLISTITLAELSLVNGLPLSTCNPDDFAGIDQLDVFDVPTPTLERHPQVSAASELDVVQLLHLRS